MQLSEVIVHNQHCLSSSARVLEVPVAPCVKHHEANWTFERQQRDNERWLLSLTKWNSIIGMQNRCHKFPPGIFINLYRISRWLAWTSLVTFQCSSANYAGGSQRPNTWVMKSSQRALLSSWQVCMTAVWYPLPCRLFCSPGWIDGGSAPLCAKTRAENWCSAVLHVSLPPAAQ